MQVCLARHTNSPPTIKETGETEQERTFDIFFPVRILCLRLQ
eukprot:SAG31_NODE_3405_length_4311_cov_2.512821_3_plen_42_part_00